MSEPLSEVAPALPAGGGAGATEEQTTDEFKERVDRILELIGEDSQVRDRVLVELYVTIAEFKAEFDRMQQEFEHLGPKAFFKMLRGGI